MIPLLEIAMDTIQHLRAIEVDWLGASPIGPHAAAFKLHLTERRYAAHTVSSYVAEVTHFARWVCTRLQAIGAPAILCSYPAESPIARPATC